MIKVVWTQNGIDYQLGSEQLTNDDGLGPMIVFCLFTDARVTDEQLLANVSSRSDTDKRGWPGNSYADFEWGSRLWLLSREKITRSLLNRAHDYTREALQPLIDFKLVKSVSVAVSRSSLNTVQLIITITKPDNTIGNYQAQLIWASTIATTTIIEEI